MFVVMCLAVAGCASFQNFLERDQRRVDGWNRVETDRDTVCVVVGEECKGIPRDMYEEEQEAIETAAKDANAEWRRSRPLAADLVSAH